MKKGYTLSLFLWAFSAVALQHQDTANRVLIIDFGSQYSQLIARRIREIGVYCEVHPWSMDTEKIIAFNPSGIIFSGGPESITTENSPRANPIFFQLNRPILGICYGMQTIAAQLGAEVQTAECAEFGHATITIDEPSLLFKGLSLTLDVWMSHNDQVVTLPKGFMLLAQSDNSAIVAMADIQRNIYGVQFHPEVSHTECGTQLLRNFVIDICHCEPTWKEEHIVDHLVAEIQNRVGSDHVMLAVSGGVDSSVLALLLNRAIGDRLHCVFVDNGLLRLHECEQIVSMFDQLGIPLTCINARDHFLHMLAGVTDPENKRLIIGREFIRLFEREARTYNNLWFAQGTIYSDVIESAQTSSATRCIKSHHNVGGLPSDMALRLLEPLRFLFKDEVRMIGKRLGLPEYMLHRHPFPGPGLAIRILGEVKEEYLKSLALADAIFLQELRNADLYERVSQAFVVFLPVRSVSVKGDARCYEHVVALRAVESTDFMTARWAALPSDLLALVSSRILNEVPGISRVVYDISNKPPATIEWE